MNADNNVDILVAVGADVESGWVGIGVRVVDNPKSIRVQIIRLAEINWRGVISRIISNLKLGSSDAGERRMTGQVHTSLPATKILDLGTLGRDLGRPVQAVLSLP